MGVAEILALISAGESIAGSIIVAIRNKRGGIDISIILDETDANFDANKKQINDWLVSKGKAPMPPTP